MNFCCVSAALVCSFQVRVVLARRKKNRMKKTSRSAVTTHLRQVHVPPVPDPHLADQSGILSSSLQLRLGDLGVPLVSVLQRVSEKGVFRPSATKSGAALWSHVCVVLVVVEDPPPAG